MGRATLLGTTLAGLLLASPAAAADEKCLLQRVAELPVTMDGTRPLIEGTINGQPARFLADSGAFFSILTGETAARHGLRTRSLPGGMIVSGAGGTERMKMTEVQQFSLAGFLQGRPFEDLEFLVGADRILGDLDGIIGQNLIGRGDTEFDLANGVIRVFAPKNCEGAMLAYWADPETRVAELPFKKRTAAEPLLITSARLNGSKIRVILDTGAFGSILTRRAAARAGIDLEGEGVSAAGISGGIGKSVAENSIALFESLDLGGELIRNARLRVGNIKINDTADMLLGADFFLSHRIYVDSRENKIYFTYNGGPVFDLSRDESEVAEAAASVDVAAVPALLHAAAPSPESAKESARLRGRGAASAGRRDFKAALADFDQAIALDPTDGESYFLRAQAYMETDRAPEALADLDQALMRKPAHVQALMLRGTARLALDSDADVGEDFTAAQRLAPRNYELALDASRALAGAGRIAEAIAPLDAWIEAHPENDRRFDVLHGRCRVRALANLDLSQALADCDLALRKGSRSSLAYNSRALVHLRLGSYEDAVDDYDEALERQPRDAMSLYGRGLARLRQGETEQGESDLAAARALDPEVEAQFRALGIEP